MAGRGGNVGDYIFIIKYVCMYICYSDSGVGLFVCLYFKTLGAAAVMYSERVADRKKKIWKPMLFWRRGRSDAHDETLNNWSVGNGE